MCLMLNDDPALLPKPHLFQPLIVFIDEMKVREEIAKN